jgi:hypothetical protein
VGPEIAVTAQPGVEIAEPDDLEIGITEKGSGTQEDIGGVTLRRISAGRSGLTTRQSDDGSTVYSGAVAAGLAPTASSASSR